MPAPESGQIEVPSEPGTHTIRVLRKGHLAFETEVSLTEGEKVRVVPRW